MGLQKFQNSAARVITAADYDERSSEVLTTLGWQALKIYSFSKKYISKYL